MRQLDEDKIVKFNNEMFPKFGWCAIMAGGAGSGKGTALKNDVAIEGIHYDPDELKRLKLKLWHIEYNEYDDDMLVTDDGEKYSLEAVGKPYTLRNEKFTSLVHQVCRPAVKRFKKMLLKQAGTADERRLPNIIFDVTLSEVSDYESLIPLVKEIGYKIAIIYVFTNFDRAVSQNADRDRVVPIETMFYTHAGFIDALQDVMKRPDIISMVDDVWVILTDLKDEPVKVFSIKDGNKLNLTKDPRAKDRIEKFISDNRKLIRQREMDHMMQQADEPSDALVDMAESWVYIPYDIIKKVKS